MNNHQKWAMTGFLSFGGEDQKMYTSDPALTDRFNFRQIGLGEGSLV